MWSRLPLERMQRIFGDNVTREQVSSMAPEVRSKKLREYSYKVTGKANKRIARLDESGLRSPAYRHWMDDGGGVKFGIRGKDDDGVVEEIQRAEKFNFMRTSTVTGASDFVLDIGDRLEITGDRLDIQNISNKVFAVARRLDEYLKVSGDGEVGSDRLQKYVSNFIQDNRLTAMDTDSLVDMLTGYDIVGDIQSGHRRQVQGVVQNEAGLEMFHDDDGFWT